MVDYQTDKFDVYSVKLFDGEAVTFTLDSQVTKSSCVIQLVAPDVKSVQAYYSVLRVLGFEGSLWHRTFTYTPAKDAVYHIIVRATAGSGSTYGFTISGSAEVPPSPAYLRLRTSATKVKKGRSVTLSAKLVNGDSVLIPGYKAKLYRSYNGRSWRLVKSLSSSTGKYTQRARITRKTWFKMRFGGNSTWSSCNSRKVTVRPR